MSPTPSLTAAVSTKFDQGHLHPGCWWCHRRPCSILQPDVHAMSTPERASRRSRWRSSRGQLQVGSSSGTPSAPSRPHAWPSKITPSSWDEPFYPRSGSAEIKRVSLAPIEDGPPSGSMQEVRQSLLDEVLPTRFATLSGELGDVLGEGLDSSTDQDQLRTPVGLR